MQHKDPQIIIRGNIPIASKTCHFYLCYRYTRLPFERDKAKSRTKPTVGVLHSFAICSGICPATSAPSNPSKLVGTKAQNFLIGWSDFSSSIYTSILVTSISRDDRLLRPLIPHDNIIGAVKYLHQVPSQPLRVVEVVV